MSVQLEKKIEGINSHINKRLDKFEDRFDKWLEVSTEIQMEVSKALNEIGNQNIRHDAQEKLQESHKIEMSALKDKYYDLDKKADLSIQSEKQIIKTAEEIKGILKATAKWAFTIFSSLLLAIAYMVIK